MGKLYDFSINKVKEACHKYWIDKDASGFLDNVTCADVPKIGLCDPAWEELYGITSEYYNGYVQGEDVCLVSARIALADRTERNSEEFITNATILCKLKDDIIQFQSIHISRMDGKSIAPNRALLTDSYYRKTLDFIYDVVLEYQTANNVLTYDKDRYRDLFEVNTHFINIDQWFWHMCTECMLPEDSENMDVFRGIDIEKRLRTNENIFSKFIRIKNREKGLIWIKITITIIPNANNTNIERIIIMFKNVDDEMKERMQNLTHARIDSLTKVWNRYYTEKLINESLSLFPDGIYILFDIDKFKLVNDTYGHITGDSILKKIASVISSNISVRDIFGRIGGDEFVLFMANGTDEIEVMKKITNILNAVNFDYSEYNIDMKIQCSIGVVRAGPNLNDFGLLYKEADKALYEAKKTGRNIYKIT